MGRSSGLAFRSDTEWPRELIPGTSPEDTLMTRTSICVIRDQSIVQPPVFLVLIDQALGRISVRGDLDRAHVQHFVNAVDVLAHSSAGQWTIDVAGITFCDAGGLRGLQHAHEAAVRAGRSLVVVGPNRMVSRLLTLVGLDRLLMDTADRRR